MAAAGTCGTGTRSTGSMVAAASTNNVTSFQRRGPRASGADSGCSRLVSIAGTRPSVRNGQLLVSTGLPALDQLLDFNLASLITQRVKYPPVMPETQEKRVRSLDWEDPLEKEMATHTNILARRIPWTEESIGLQAMESQRVEYH